MKKTATILILMAAIGLSAQDSTSQAFAQAANSAQKRLDQSLEEYKTLLREIHAAKPVLGAQLDDVENRALTLRDEASNAARTKATFDLEVSQLEKEKTSVIETNNYIQSTLINEYIRRFQLSIDPSEIPLYNETLIRTLGLLDSEEEIADSTIFKAQIEVIKTALDRVEKLIGGTTFEGSATVEGTIIDGSFALIGPVSYFSDGQGLVGITEGMINNRAKIYPLPLSAAGINATVSTLTGTLPVDTTDGEALEGIRHTITLQEEFKLGGFVMYPILSLFVLAILIAVYKAIELFMVKAARTKDIDVILDHLRSGKTDAALSHAKSVGGPVGSMLCAAVENASEDREVIEEVLYENIIKTQPKLERFLAFIAVVAATAPLLGLLGTVTGMIKTFKLITIVGTGDARNLSSGISEALITTKWGLIVAIPTLIMHALLNRKAKGVVGSMEQAAVSFINGVTEMRGEAGNK